MSRYVFKLRRGWKYDADPETGLPRDDWAAYEEKPAAERKDPLPGELVLEYDNGVPRLKIGDGIHKFSQLPYISVDSFILPTSVSITLDPNAWNPVLDENGNPIENRYYQPVTVTNAIVTKNSKIDLQPTPEQLAVFYMKDITLTAINAGGNVRVCVVGQKPTQEYTIQATVTEVVFDV